MLYETGMRQSGVKPFSLDVTGSGDSILKKLNHTKPMDVDRETPPEKSQPRNDLECDVNMGFVQNPPNMVRNRAGTFGSGVIDNGEKK